MKRYTIYYLKRKKDGLIFYVGKTEKALHLRLANHWSELKAANCSILKKEIMLAVGKNDIDIVEIEDIECISEMSCNREKFWIQQFMRNGYKLCNRTDYVNNYEFTYTPKLGIIKRISEKINAPFYYFQIHSRKPVRDYD